MNWQRLDKHRIASEQGYVIRGDRRRDDSVFYHAWLPETLGGGPVKFGCGDGADGLAECKKRCQEDWKARQQGSTNAAQAAGA